MDFLPLESTPQSTMMMDGWMDRTESWDAIVSKNTSSEKFKVNIGHTCHTFQACFMPTSIEGTKEVTLS